jgi:Domain of unknown function (DUF5666)
MSASMMSFKHLTPRLRTLLIAANAPLLLIACGGDQIAVAPGGGGTGSTVDNGVFVAVGPITQLNPLTVNGVTFSTAATTLIVENGDDPGSGLQVGMIARVDGRTSTANASVQARSLIAGAELRGEANEIDLNTQTFKSVGVLVEIDPSTRFEGAANRLASISTNDYVQIHGYPSGDNRIRASLVIKRAASSEVKFTATVDAGSCGECRPGQRDFLAAGNVIRLAADANSSPPPEVGTLVKIVGERAGTNIIAAREVTAYNIAEPPADGSRIVIQGLITNSQSSQTFKVTGLPVETTNATQVLDSSRFGATIASGNLVEVEGTQQARVLKAAKIIRR